MKLQIYVHCPILAVVLDSVRNNIVDYQLVLIPVGLELRFAQQKVFLILYFDALLLNLGIENRHYFFDNLLHSVSNSLRGGIFTIADFHFS